MVSHFSKMISNELTKHRNQEWNGQLSSLDKNDKPFWNIIKIVKNKNRTLPFLKDSTSIYFTDNEKAEELARNFSKNHLVSQCLGDGETNELVKVQIQNTNALDVTTPTNAFVNEENITNIIKNLKTRKAGGLDSIKNVYLKNLSRNGIRYLTFIINSCLKLQYFPNAWKKAKVVPILKAGKPPDVSSSYRPISLLSSISKIYEKVIKDQISKFVSNSNLLPNEQFGFRSCHSTSHQIKRICNHVKEHRLQEQSTGMIVLDIEKAFDSVWHDGLVYKMINFKFPLYLCKIVQSFLSDRCFQVHVNSGVSNLRFFYFGVPQGSVLGPSLYNIYTSDFPMLPFCQSALFADDTAIFTSHKLSLNIETNLKNAIEILEKYYGKWKIKLNAGKMQAIFFSRKRKACFLPSNQIHINGNIIEWKQTVKYLGVNLDTKLTFRDHIHTTLKKINLAIKMLYPFINRKSPLSNKNKILIHKLIFQSILLYGCPIWENAAKCHIKKLQISQNKILKMMLNLPWYHSTLDLHNKASVELISDRICKLSNNFYNGCVISENPLIQKLAMITNN